MRIVRRLPGRLAASRRGRLTLIYDGDARVEPASLGVRAGARSAALRVRVERAADRVVVTGTVAARLGGSVRIEVRDGAEDRVLYERTVRVRAGGFSARLPVQARGQLVVSHAGARRGGFAGAVLRYPIT